MCFISIGDELMMMMPLHYLAEKNELSEFDHLKLRPNKKIPVFTVTWENSSGRVGLNIFFSFFFCVPNFKCF